MVSNDISRYGDTGISIFGSKPANLKVVGNNISGGPAGIYVADTKGGFFAGNTIHDNCAGMFFEADGSKEPVSGFEVKANTVKNNTRSCHRGIREESLGGRHRASRHDEHGGYGQPPLGQRPLRSHPYLGWGRGLDGRALRRIGETPEQLRNRQPLWP